MVDWYTEAHLGSISQTLWHVTMQELSQQPLSNSISDLNGCRESPSELHDAMIQVRSPGLETYSHAGPVHLHQNVIRQVGHEIERHHRWERRLQTPSGG